MAEAVTAPGNSLILTLLTLGVFLSGAYAIGRIHQWRKYGIERDEAYRTGYEKASRAIVGMMTARHSDPPREHGLTRIQIRPRGRRGAPHMPHHRLSAGRQQPYRQDEDDRVGA